MMRLFLVLLLLALQDTDRTALLRQLGDSSPEVRASAMSALEAQGEAAEPDLKKALNGGDPEVRARVESLLARLEHRRWLEPLKAAQRPQKLQRPDAGNPPEGALADTDGVRFGFRRESWSPDGKVLGTRFRISADAVRGVELQWTVAAVRHGSDLPLETCSFHSPEIVYVPGEPPAQAQVVVRGLRRWTCDVPVVFTNPADGQTKRVGNYVVTVRWPELVVRPDAPVSKGVIAGVLWDRDITSTLKPGRDRNELRFGGRENFVVTSRCGRAGLPAGPRAWCGCVGQPSRALLQAEPLSEETRARERLLANYEVDDIASIKLTFHLPVEESFEVISPSLK
jgi:hypothetical protein